MNTAWSTKARIGFATVAAAGFVALVAPAAGAATPAHAAPAASAQDRAACTAILGDASDNAYNASWEVHVTDQDYTVEVGAARADLRDPACAPFLTAQVQGYVSQAQSLLDSGTLLAQQGQETGADNAFEGAGQALAWAQYYVRQG